jgi:hypothetical protein
VGVKTFAILYILLYEGELCVYNGFFIVPDSAHYHHIPWKHIGYERSANKSTEHGEEKRQVFMTVEVTEL